MLILGLNYDYTKKHVHISAGICSAVLWVTVGHACRISKQHAKLEHLVS